MMDKKLYDLWMEAIINYSNANLCNNETMSAYYLGQVHILSSVLNLPITKLKFWWRVFDDCQKIICG